MIIGLDPRAGSGDLAPLLEHRVSLQVQQREYGDAWFEGQGPRGPVKIGVEIKKIQDAATCMVDQRFAGHQLPGLLGDYNVVYLVLEGTYRCGGDGSLLIERIVKWPGGSKTISSPAKGGGIDFSRFERWLTSIEEKAAVRLRHTSGRLETAQLLIDLAAWWAKPWASHSALQAFDPQLHLRPDRVLLVKPGFVARVIKEFPGIGWDKHKGVLRRFPTVLAAVEAPIPEWESIPGIGKTLAARIFGALRRKC